jgi:hypothetical protein
MNGTSDDNSIKISCGAVAHILARNSRGTMTKYLAQPHGKTD